MKTKPEEPLAYSESHKDGVVVLQLLTTEWWPQVKQDLQLLSNRWDTVI